MEKRIKKERKNVIRRRRRKKEKQAGAELCQAQFKLGIAKLRKLPLK